MLNEGLLVKVAVAPGAAVIFAELLPRVVSEGFGAIAVVAAGIGGTGYLYHLTRRGRRNARALIARVQNGLDIIEETPDRFKKLEQRADRHREELIKHSKALDLLAETDSYRIKDAIAGDERSPVDRRSAA